MYTKTFDRCFLATLVLAISILAGCNGSSGAGTGTLNLAIADTPVDGATSVMVSFTGVDIQPADDQDESGGGMDDMDGMGDMNGGNGSGDDTQRLKFDFAAPRQIDLMQQQGGTSATLLSGVSLPAGHYAWIRLKIDTGQSTITLKDGSVHPLFIPSGAETGLKLVRGFTVASGGTVDFTIDFDLRRSITLANGKYILKPALRIMDDVAVGRISGIAANTLLIGTIAISAPTCMPAAYIYAGTNVTPVDIAPRASVQPVTTATLRLDDETGDFAYSADFLAPGSYTVALVCAAQDDPSLADSLSFSAAKDVTVNAGSTTTVDFP